MVRGGFRAYVKDKAEATRLREAVNAKLADKDFPVVSGVGRTVEHAFKAIDKVKEEQRAKGAFPQRDKLSPDFEKRLPNLKFSDERTNRPLPAALVEAVKGLSRKEAFEKAYVEPKTGLLSAKGWNLIPRKKYVVAIDLRGLKIINDLHGKASGDHFIEHFGQQATKAGGSDFDFAHRSGDEYLAQSNSREELVHHLDDLRAALEKSTLPLTDPDTGRTMQIAVRFRHGIGEGEHAEVSADRELNRQRVNERTGNAGPRAAGGQAGGRGSDAGRGERQALDRVEGRPQGFPEEVADSRPGVIAEAPEGGTFRLNAGKKGERGFITFNAPEDGEPRRFNIHLLANADQSTLAHETFHFLAEVMGDVASQPEAPADLKQDYQTLLSYMGHESHEARVAAAEERRALSDLETRTPEEQARLTELTAREEKATHAWEQYLGEGKAPSAELAGAFTRFRRWMTRIYKGLSGVAQQFRQSYGQELELSDDVRKVFDRLLASDEEIRKAEAANVAAQPFASLVDSMPPEQRDEYMRLTVAAREQAKDEMVRRIAEGQRKENTAFMRGERERIRSEVEQELEQNPTYRTLRILQGQGDIPEVLRTADGKPMRLDRAELVKKYGKDFVGTLPRGLFAEKGQGTPSETLAALHGWDDADSMVRALQQAKPLGETVASEVQQRMEQAHGPELLDNPQELARLAMDSVHTPAAARKAVLELNALRKALLAGAPDAMNPERAAREKLQENVAAEKAQRGEQDKAAKTDAAQEARFRAMQRAELTKGWDLKEARAMADSLVSEKTVGELTAGEFGLAGRYEKAERTMAKRSLEAAAKGDFMSAIAFKEKQLLNQALYESARELRGTFEAAADKLKGSSKASWRAALGKADPAYRNAHDAVLQAIGMQEPAPGQPKVALEPFLAKAAADAQEIGFDTEGLRTLIANPKSWGELTVAEAQNVLDAVTNIRHMANAVTEVELAGKKQSVDDFFRELEEAVSKRKPLPPEPVSRTVGKTVGQRLGGWGRGADAVLANMETFAAALDGGNRNGPAHRLLVDGRLEARAKETELTKAVIEPIRKAFDAIPKDIKKLRDQKVDAVDGIPMSALLPVRPGSEGRIAPVYTRDSIWMLFLNYGNEGNRQRLQDGNGFASANIEKALSVLSKPETDFLQSILDSIESIKPELAKAYERRTGLPMGVVEAAPIKVNGQTYRGGYFPLKYDSRYARQGAVQEADVVASLFPAGYKPPFVASGHTKARLERVAAPVDLSFGVVPAHLAQVIHDVSYGDWVRQAGRIVMDGGDRFRQLSSQYLGPEYTAQFVPWLRDVANARADSASGSASEALGEVSGFARSKLAIGVMGLNVPSLLAHLVDPLTTKLSGVPLRHIASAYLKTMGRGVPGVRSLIDPAEGIPLSPEMQFRTAQHEANIRKAMREMGPKGGGLMEAINDVVFKAHEMSEHFTTTVAYRAAYEHSISSGKTQEEAIRLADDAVRQNFPSPDLADKPAVLRSRRGWTSALMFYGYANKLYNQLSRAGHEGGPGRLAASALYLGVVGAGAAYLSGKGPDPEEDRKAWLGRKVLLDPLNTIPFLGGIAEALATGHKVDVRTVPELAFVAEMANRMEGLYKHATGGDSSAEEKLLSLMETVAGGLGPVHQAKRTLGYAKQLSTGEAQPRGPGDVASGLLYGKRDKQPGNPLTDAQDAVSQ
jgi:GGDEF domain-containing protein